MIKKFKYTVVILGVLLSGGVKLLPLVLHYPPAVRISLLVKLALWASTPYLIYGVVAMAVKNRAGIIVTGLLLLGLDLFAHVYFIFFSTSSTTALGFFFTPFWLIALVIPIGFVGSSIVGWIAAKLPGKASTSPN